MDPYEHEALVRFTESVSLNRISVEADTLIDTATSLNFVIKDFVMANDFYEYCKTAFKMAIRVASEQRISTNKLFRLSVFTINEHEFNGLQFRVLPHFKSSDIIFGLPALSQLDVVIHPSINAFSMGNFTINCNRDSRRI
jgi:hypothetical protein